MGLHATKNDCLWSSSGDFALDTVRGDLKDTRAYTLRALIQQIETHIQSNKGNWLLHPTIGIQLRNFVGKPNNEELGLQLENSVRNEFLQSGLLRANELNVRVFPTSKDSVMILLEITPNGEREQVKLAFSYNTQENAISPRLTQWL